jgi:hypothetical protein
MLLMAGGWRNVAALLLAASFYLPRLPRHYLWPWCVHWNQALMLAPCFLAPIWPHWWQRWVTGIALAHNLVLRSFKLWQNRSNARHSG